MIACTAVGAVNNSRERTLENLCRKQGKALSMTRTNWDDPQRTQTPSKRLALQKLSILPDPPIHALDPESRITSPISLVGVLSRSEFRAKRQTYSLSNKESKTTEKICPEKCKKNTRWVDNKYKRTHHDIDENTIGQCACKL